MNDYIDQTLTMDDWPSVEGDRDDERGSTFTNCTFNPGTGAAILFRIDFSFALFTNCTWNVDVRDCMFLSAEGDTPPVTNILFDTAPANELQIDDDRGWLLKGDGVETSFDVSRASEANLITALTDAGFAAEDYTITMGRCYYDAQVEPTHFTRAEWLADAHIHLSTDATDTYDPFDGIPDIVANGTSYCTIDIKMMHNDETVDTGDDTTVVDIDASRGLLSAIRVTLSSGVASVTLTSVAETCISDITARVGGIIVDTIKIQFAPGA